MNEDRNKAMIYVINFFKSRMNAMNKASISKAKELISTHEISVSELVDKYIELVISSS